MEYRKLGRTGVRVSPLCLGCMMFGGRANADDSYAMIEHAIGEGINFIDTANVYGRGESETVTGEGIKRTGKRAQIVLATKVQGQMADDDPNASGNSRRHIVQQCEASLRRLQTDYIDLYQIHRPRSDTPIDETLRALDDLVRSGKVRYIGSSTFAAWQVVESLWASRELGLNRFVCEQPPYNLLDRRVERELLPMAATHGLAIIPWSPLAGGLLSGKYSPDDAAPTGSRFFDAKSSALRERWSAEAWAVIDELRSMAGEKACTVSQLALAWCVQQPHVTSPIIGPRTLDQLRDNLKALDLEITAEDRERLDKVAPPAQYSAPFYGADFGPHEFRW
jgi:aryl-alcohol dehydrogenase-like predicted oxidoreductase